MRHVAIAAIGFFVFSHGAEAAPAWSALSFTVTPQNAPRVVAATDKLMASEVGKEFPGKLLLQSHVADGDNPATHTFVPIYETAAARETFVQKLQADPAWTAFQNTMTEASEPVAQVAYRTLKTWGDLAETDVVWRGHAFAVSDPETFVSAIDALMASPTGQKFPGQVYVSSVVAGGLSPVTHAISVGYASEAEMDAWIDTINASEDWAEFLDATEDAADHLGASLLRTVKTWGPATLAEIVKK